MTVEKMGKDADGCLAKMGYVRGQEFPEVGKLEEDLKNTVFSIKAKSTDLL